MSAARIVWLVLTIIVVVAAGYGIWLVTGPGPLDFAGGTRVPLAEYKGADPTGVPASLKSADIVTRGKYLAEMADCMVCHTAKGGAPYAGGFAINLPFGTIYSANITADKDTGIGNWTDAQFLGALHRGVDDEGEHLYPAMPYSSYTHMSDADALAIKAYLFSLPPVHQENPETKLRFPFNQRWLMGIWNIFFAPDKRFEPNAQQSPEWNRGAYLATALAHCDECHTPRNIAFGLDHRRKFAGAVTAGWNAYNITSDKTAGIGAWSDEEVAQYLATGHAQARGTASGPMGEAVDDSLSKMAPEDIKALALFVRSVPAQSSDLPAPRTTPAPASHREGVAVANASGKEVFQGACASCHDWTGTSAIIPYATFTGARAVNDPSAVNVAQVVLLGIKRDTADGAVVMPAFGDAYSDAEIAAVANYVTARFGAKTSNLTAADVAALRKQTAQTQ
jgi:mono/diheme cytochrome c family protein